VNRDRLRLLHIRDAIARIRSYVNREDDFRHEPVVQDAVIRNLEAATKQRNNHCRCY